MYHTARARPNPLAGIHEPPPPPLLAPLTPLAIIVDLLCAGSSGDRYRRYPLGDVKDFSSMFFPEKENLLKILANFEKKSGKHPPEGHILPRTAIHAFRLQGHMALIGVHERAPTSCFSYVQPRRKPVGCCTEQHGLSVPLMKDLPVVEQASKVQARESRPLHGALVRQGVSTYGNEAFVLVSSNWFYCVHVHDTNSKHL